MRIDVEIVDAAPLGIDTTEDLERARDNPEGSDNEEDHCLSGRAGRQFHIACSDVYPGWETLPCASFEEAFAAISEGRAHFGMIPIEDSLAGRVADIHHFLPDSGLHIIGDYFLPIHFHLLGVKGAKIEDLRSVTAMSTRWANAARSSGINLKAVATGDTAVSAREVAQ